MCVIENVLRLHKGKAMSVSVTQTQITRTFLKMNKCNDPPSIAPTANTCPLSWPAYHNSNAIKIFKASVVCVVFIFISS